MNAVASIFTKAWPASMACTPNLLYSRMHTCREKAIFIVPMRNLIERRNLKICKKNQVLKLLACCLLGKWRLLKKARASGCLSNSTWVVHLLSNLRKQFPPASVRLGQLSTASLTGIKTRQPRNEGVLFWKMNECQTLTMVLLVLEKLGRKPLFEL